MLAGLFPNLVNLILLPIYTRFLDPADYGLVSLVTTLVSFLATGAGLQLANSSARLYFDYRGERLKTYVSTILFSLLLINVLLLTGYHLAGPQLTSWLFPRVEIPYFPYVFLGLVGLFFMTVVNFAKGLFRVQERARIFFAGSLSFVIAGAGFGIYFVVVRRMGPRGVLLATASNAALHAVVLSFFIRSLLRLRFEFKILRSALSYSLPLIPHAMGLVLFSYTDKYILSFYVPLSAIGIYDLAVRLTTAMKMFVASYHAAMNPDFVRSSLIDRTDTIERYTGIITRWAALLAGVFLGVSLFAESIIRLLSPPAYHSAYRLVPILAAGIVFYGLHGFPIAALMVEKRTRVFPVITLGAGLLNVGLNLWLIPIYGVPAAAWTTLISYASAFLLSLWLSRCYYALRFQWRRLAFAAGLALILLAFGWLAPFRDYFTVILFRVMLLLTYAGMVMAVNLGGIRDVARDLLKATRARLNFGGR